MNLQEAKEFLRTLWNDDLMYHLDDDAVDCLYESNKVTTLKRAKAIQKAVDEIYEAQLDWGLYDCPIGYCLHLMAMDKASCIIK
tara:strand:+ start:211 stop:462 length:252 start_codon:yes stop_codon:yes gene_type:complete